jgi:cyclic pyranopterin phosphate synthase
MKGRWPMPVIAKQKITPRTKTLRSKRPETREEKMIAALSPTLNVMVNAVRRVGQNIVHDFREVSNLQISEKGPGDFVSNADLFSLISGRYPGIKRDYRIHGNGPAVYYRIPGFTGSLGMISAIHGKFCHSCNRIRMTATGDIKSCLCYDKGINIRDAVRNNDREQIRDILKEAILEKPMMHRFEDKNEITEHKKMVQIGG